MEAGPTYSTIGYVVDLEAAVFLQSVRPQTPPFMISHAASPSHSVNVEVAQQLYPYQFVVSGDVIAWCATVLQLPEPLVCQLASQSLNHPSLRKCRFSAAVNED